MLFNPFAEYKVTQGWHAAHQAIDFGTPWGTTFGSPDAGTYHHLGGSLGYSSTPGTPGLWGELRRADGSKIRFAHLSAHIAGNGAPVSAGDSLAATGNSGYVIPAPTRANPRAGSHMHTYGLDRFGNRWNWIPGSATAGGGGKEFDVTFTDQDRARLENVEAALLGMGGTPPQSGSLTRKINDLVGQRNNPAWVIITDASPGPGQGRAYLVSLLTGRREHILNPTDLALLERAARGVERMTAAQIATVAGYFAKVNPPTTATVDVDAVATAISQKLSHVGGASPDEVRSIVYGAFASVTYEAKVKA